MIYKCLLTNRIEKKRGNTFSDVRRPVLRRVQKQTEYPFSCCNDLPPLPLFWLRTTIMDKHLRFNQETKRKVLYFAMYNVHPCFRPKRSGKNFFYSTFYLFTFRNKADYHIPGYYFAYRYCYCFLELHF